MLTSYQFWKWKKANGGSLGLAASDKPGYLKIVLRKAAPEEEEAVIDVPEELINDFRDLLNQRNEQKQKGPGSPLPAAVPLEPNPKVADKQGQAAPSQSKPGASLPKPPAQRPET